MRSDLFVAAIGPATGLSALIQPPPSAHGLVVHGKTKGRRNDHQDDGPQELALYAPAELRPAGRVLTSPSRAPTTC